MEEEEEELQRRPSACSQYAPCLGGVLERDERDEARRAKQAGHLGLQRSVARSRGQRWCGRKGSPVGKTGSQCQGWRCRRRWRGYPVRRAMRILLAWSSTYTLNLNSALARECSFEFL